MTFYCTSALCRTPFFISVYVIFSKIPLSFTQTTSDLLLQVRAQIQQWLMLLRWWDFREILNPDLIYMILYGSGSVLCNIRTQYFLLFVRQRDLLSSTSAYYYVDCVIWHHNLSNTQKSFKSRSITVERNLQNHKAKCCKGWYAQNKYYPD